jgi:NAD(P)-dependent dehydrogenase (short-subunit alcohol dehydrogenase family)
MGTTDDIANVALFLSSDAASFITGGVFQCDGGQGMTGPRNLNPAWEASRK